MLGVPGCINNFYHKREAPLLSTSLNEYCIAVSSNQKVETGPIFCGPDSLQQEIK